MNSSVLPLQYTLAVSMKLPPSSVKRSSILQVFSYVTSCSFGNQGFTIITVLMKVLLKLKMQQIIKVVWKWNYSFNLQTACQTAWCLSISWTLWHHSCHWGSYSRLVLQPWLRLSHEIYIFTCILTPMFVVKCVCVSVLVLGHVS